MRDYYLEAVARGCKRILKTSEPFWENYNDCWIKTVFLNYADLFCYAPTNVIKEFDAAFEKEGIFLDMSGGNYNYYYASQEVTIDERDFIKKSRVYCISKRMDNGTYWLEARGKSHDRYNGDLSREFYRYHQLKKYTQYGI